MTTQPKAVAWLDAYRAKVDAERRDVQAEPVRKVLTDILESLKSIERNVHWALDPEESAEEVAYSLATAIQRAHDLVDLAHDYRAALKANPAPAPTPEEDNSDAE